MTILIAENSLLVAERLIRMLNEVPGPTTITHASNFAAVARAIDVYCPEVVIVDPRLAGSEGMNLLREIRRQRPSAMMIVLSNAICFAHRCRCLEAGADYFLDKTKEFDRVPAIIQFNPRRWPKLFLQSCA